MLPCDFSGVENDVRQFAVVNIWK